MTLYYAGVSKLNPVGKRARIAPLAGNVMRRLKRDLPTFKPYLLNQISAVISSTLSCDD